VVAVLVVVAVEGSSMANTALAGFENTAIGYNHCLLDSEGGNKGPT
jgi:hypothetical protein